MSMFFKLKFQVAGQYMQDIGGSLGSCCHVSEAGFTGASGLHSVS